jgi:hypothetical protein
MTTSWKKCKSLENPALKQRVQKILGLSDNLDSYWDILDVYEEEKDGNMVPKLALAHYNDDFDPKNRSTMALTYVRGVIVDVETGATVADSHGYTASLPCYTPISIGKSSTCPDGVIKFESVITSYTNDVESSPDEHPRSTVGEVKFDASKSRLFLGYEAAFIRMFKWNNKIFFSTHKTIDGTRSRWSTRDTFYSLYLRLHGPELTPILPQDLTDLGLDGKVISSSLFGDEPYSPYCHMLLVVDNQVRLASSTRDNRIVYLGVRKVWDEEEFGYADGPYYWDKEIKLKVPTTSEQLSPFSINLNRGVLVQNPVTPEIANKFLFPYDYATIIRKEDIPPDSFTPQDNELIISYSDTGSVTDIMMYRDSNQIPTDDRLRGGDFVVLYTENPDGRTVVYRVEPESYSYRVDITDNNPNLYNRFVTNSTTFVKATPTELKDQYPKIMIDNKPINLDSEENRHFYWWKLFYNAVAPIFKDEVGTYYEKYDNDVRKLAKFILNKYKKIEMTEEVKKIFTERTIARMDDLYYRATSRALRVSPFTSLLGLLYKENGVSLYKMMTTVTKYNKLETA